MKYKKIILIMLLLGVIFTIGVVSATDNTTNDVVTLEDTSYELINEQSDEINNQNISASESYDEIPLTDSPVGEYKVTEFKITDSDSSIVYGDEYMLTVSLTETIEIPVSEGKELIPKDTKIEFRLYKGDTLYLKDYTKISASEKNFKTTFVGMKFYPPANKKVNVTHYYYSSFPNHIYVDTSSCPVGTYRLEVYADGNLSFQESIKINKAKLRFASYNKVANYKSSNNFEVNVRSNIDSIYDKVKDTKFKIKIYTGSKYKTYNLKTNSRGYMTFNTKNLGVGTHKFTITCDDSNYYGTYNGKITIKKTSKSKKTTNSKTTNKKSNVKTTTIKINRPNAYFATKKLTTGDRLQTVYSKGGQYSKGVYAEVLSYDYPIHTKIKKIQFFFKSGRKVKTVTTTKISTSKYYSGGKVSLISGYTPYQAKVWYVKK